LSPAKTMTIDRRLRWTIVVTLALLGLLAPPSAAAPFFGGDKKAAEDDEATYTRLAREAMAAANAPNFDAAATLSAIRQNPAVQEKMRAMLRDPEAIKELSELMRDPTFKAQVEAFAGNPEVAAELNKKGANAFVSDTMDQPENVRRSAQAKAHADLEYEKYASQFNGKQNANMGFQSLLSASKDSSILADAMRDLQDPEMMAQAQQMMSDPSFQLEMKRMMEQPEMQQILEASRSFMSDVTKDPTKMKELQDRVAALSGGGMEL